MPETRVGSSSYRNFIAVEAINPWNLSHKLLVVTDCYNKIFVFCGPSIYRLLNFVSTPMQLTDNSLRNLKPALLCKPFQFLNCFEKCR